LGLGLACSALSRSVAVSVLLKAATNLVGVKVRVRIR